MVKINTGNANREYKDRLFRFVFGSEEKYSKTTNKKSHKLSS